MNQTVIGTTLLTALLATGCAAKYDPLRISADEFRRRVKTIAVVQVAVPPNVGEPAGSAKFHPAIESKLQAAGFTVVPAERVREVWDAKATELGGLFDQQTGVLNEAKATALINHVREQVKERFGADALALPYVRRVTANFSSMPFAGIDARWDGASESIVTSGVDKVLTPNVSGKIPALSLIVRIEDLAGTLLYAHAGGIQVVEKLSPMAGAFSRDTFVAVPRSEILADQQRIQQAVNYALDPFFRRD